MDCAGQSGYHFIELAGCWNPDAGSNYEYQEATDLLKICKYTGQYRNDSNLIVAFLYKNDSLKFFNELEEDQKTNLEPFLEWLKNFRTVDSEYFEKKLDIFQQEDKAFRSYYVDLLALYRKSFEFEDGRPFSDYDKKEIKRRFIRGVQNQEVKMNLAVQSAQNKAWNINDLILHAEHITMALKDLNETNYSNHTVEESSWNVIAREDCEENHNAKVQKLDLQEIIQETERNCANLLNKIRKTVKSIVKNRNSRMKCNYCKQQGHKSQMCKERINHVSHDKMDMKRKEFEKQKNEFPLTGAEEIFFKILQIFQDNKDIFIRNKKYIIGKQDFRQEYQENAKAFKCL